MKNQRAKTVERILRLTWESLESHLSYTHDPKDDPGFHKKAVKDYAEIIYEASKLY